MNAHGFAKSLMCGVVALAGLGVSMSKAAILTTDLTDSNSADNFLYNNGPTSNFANSGLFYYDNRQAALDKARPLIQFGLPSLPGGATITNVTLQLTIKQYTYLDGGATVHPWNFSVNKMLVPWDEATSNWNQRSAGNNWSAPGMAAGVDYDATAADTQLVSTPSANNFINVPVTWNITALYLSWLANPASNYGVAIFGPAGDPNSVAPADNTDGLFSAYNTEFNAGVPDSRRPQLIIEYVPAPGSIAGLCAGGLLLARRRRTTA